MRYRNLECEKAEDEVACGVSGYCVSYDVRIAVSPFDHRCCSQGFHGAKDKKRRGPGIKVVVCHIKDGFIIKVD